MSIEGYKNDAAKALKDEFRKIYFYDLKCSVLKTIGKVCVIETTEGAKQVFSRGVSLISVRDRYNEKFAMNASYGRALKAALRKVSSEKINRHEDKVWGNKIYKKRRNYSNINIMLDKMSVREMEYPEDIKVEVEFKIPASYILKRAIKSGFVHKSEYDISMT